MRKLLFDKKIWSVVIVILIISLVGGALWLVKNRSMGIADVEEPTNEQMEQYFEEYAKATAENDLDNILIVMSEKRPDNYGAKDIVEAPNHTYYLMYESAEVRDEAYTRFEANDTVNVEKNILMQPVEYNSWGIERMGLDNAIDTLGYGGESIRVAVIDTGLDVELFRQNYPERYLTVYNIEADSYSTDDMVDNNGHGTHVTGIIADGTPETVSFYAIRVARGTRSDMYSTDVLTAIYAAVNDGVKVINMSMGAYSWLESHKTALDYAKERGIVTVAAAGNDASNEVLYPAGYDNTLSVSAINQDLSFASYSNYGDTIDFAAPGTNVQSINGYTNGTSVAAPHVSAAVAALESFNPSLSFDDTKQLLKEHTQDLGAAGWDEQFGYGLINFSNASFCDGEFCDEFGVFATDAPDYTKVEISEVRLTELNYYSVQNLMLTEVKLYTDGTHYVTKKLQEINDLTISGYDAEVLGEQNVTISCEGVSTVAKVTNPEDYPSGWEYTLDEHDDILLTSYTDLKDWDWENESVTKLYIPNTIGGKKVVALSGSERSYTYGENDEYTSTYTVAVFSNSVYAQSLVEEANLPANLVRIGDETFTNFTALKKVVMEADAVEVGYGAFRGARRLKTVDGRIAKLGGWAFASANALRNVTLAEGLEEISDNAFSDCLSLTEIEIPATVTRIGYNAFSEDYSLGRVTFAGNGVRTIENGAFRKTFSLSSIVFPDGLETIGYSAFEESGLVSVSIPASVTEIGSSAFGKSGKLETIVVDDENQEYYDVDDKALMYNRYSEVTLLAGTRSFLIPSDTTRIDSQAFAGFDVVGVLAIPDSVRNIGYEAFYGCNGLIVVAVPKGAYVGSGAFAKGRDSAYNYVASDTKLVVYNDSSAYDYAVEGGFNYETVDASYAMVVRTFDYGDTLQSDTEVELYYDYGIREDGAFTNHVGVDGRRVVKRVDELMATEYSGEVQYFRIGDTFFMAYYKDNYDENANIRVNVTVRGDLPEYTVPTGITGKLRTYLRDVALPRGFSFVNNGEYLSQLGEHTFMARYVPEDSTMYAPIENIEITVTVVYGRERLPEPEITLRNKVYDGDWYISSDYYSVNIDGLNKNSYSAYAYTYDKEIGTTTAIVIVNLDTDAALEYGFGDEYVSYYEYVVDDYEILSDAEIPEPTIDNRTNGTAETEVLADGIMVTSEKACTVIITRDGGETYSNVAAMATGEENTYKFAFEITADAEVMVVLKGDLDMRGSLNARDSARIKYYVLSRDNPNHRDLTALELLIADVNGSGSVTARDAALVDYAILSNDNPNHRALGW